MPGKHTSGTLDEPCRRCKQSNAVLVVRTEPLCRECFIRYVHTKAIKRMESFRVRNAAADHQRKILLALSFGVSSVTLLHIIHHHLKTQKTKTGRTGFSLSVLFVDSGSVQVSSPGAALAKVEQEYPDHEYKSLPLHEGVRLLPDDASLSGLVSASSTRGDTSPAENLSNLINSLNSATARADVISTFRTRLIVEHAKSTDCEAILWGDSTTKLAEKTLSETAKGRGFSLPWQVADGETPFGIAFHYPLRDLLKKELISYVDLSESSLTSLVEPSRATQASMSSKNTTIDDLMKQYFESVEENFPSIVSNVVRTTTFAACLSLEVASGSIGGEVTRKTESTCTQVKKLRGSAMDAFDPSRNQ